jgi:hypothetical protein
VAFLILTPGCPPFVDSTWGPFERNEDVAQPFDSTATRRDPMSAPSEEQILEKAKELCRCEGKAWNLDDFKNGVSGVTMLTVVADDGDRTGYLIRAKAFLKQKHHPVRSA